MHGCRSTNSTILLWRRNRIVDHKYILSLKYVRTSTNTFSPRDATQIHDEFNAYAFVHRHFMIHTLETKDRLSLVINVAHVDTCYGRTVEYQGKRSKSRKNIIHELCTTKHGFDTNLITKNLADDANIYAPPFSFTRFRPFTSSKKKHLWVRVDVNFF